MMIVVGQLVTWLSQKAAKAKEIETSKRLQQTIIESLSHELRTPLSAIKGASSILVSKELKISDEDTQELYKSIDDGAERMRRLVDNLLDTARIHSGMLKLNIDECDITELLFSALQKTKNYDNVELLLEQDASRSILGDAVLIELALINLLDNAFKYGESIRIRLYEDNHGIYVQICNNGLVPMPYEIKEDYKPFERLNNVQGKEGLGLGLYVATSIAQMHGGTISVKSDGQEYCATIGFSNRITR
jgi:two-component system sensor histidine kinase KdpD